MVVSVKQSVPMIYNADHTNSSILYWPGIEDNFLDRVYLVNEVTSQVMISSSSSAWQIIEVLQTGNLSNPPTPPSTKKCI